MSKKHPKRCPHCGFLDVIKKGKRAGHTRYYCKSCGSYFTDRRTYVFLKNKKVCLVLYRDVNIQMTLFYRLTAGERFWELQQDFRDIKALQIQIESVTCNGGSAILKAVQEVCPEAILQRCTVHIAREIETRITRKPKSRAARELLELVHLLGRIEDHTEAQLWMRAFIDWYRNWEAFINAKSIDEVTGHWWFTHRILHRSTSHIKRALPYMFNYTRYPNVPKSSNSIESFFGHLKDHLRIHRGLSEEHFKNFVNWYLFFQSNGMIQKQERE